MICISENNDRRETKNDQRTNTRSNKKMTEYGVRGAGMKIVYGIYHDIPEVERPVHRWSMETLFIFFFVYYSKNIRLLFVPFIIHVSRDIYSSKKIRQKYYFPRYNLLLGCRL